jgi:uncharacterized protein YbcI
MTGLNSRHDLDYRIVNILTEMQSNNVLVNEKSIDVEIFHDHLAITLRGIMSSAERLYARNQKNKAFLLLLYTRQFVGLPQAVADDVYRTLNKICRGIELAIEPGLGDVILTLTLSDE